MRTKTSWEVVEDSNGKKMPQKIGLKPEQREGMEYEFTLVLDLFVDGHIVTASKDRTSLFDGRHFKPSHEAGTELAEWLNNGLDPQEISTALLTRLTNKVDTIKAVPHLENWWRKHLPEIDRLLPDDRDSLTAHCSDHKKNIQKESSSRRIAQVK